MPERRRSVLRSGAQRRLLTVSGSVRGFCRRSGARARCAGCGPVPRPRPHFSRSPAGPSQTRLANSQTRLAGSGGRSSKTPRFSRPHYCTIVPIEATLSEVGRGILEEHRCAAARPSGNRGGLTIARSFRLRRVPRVRRRCGFGGAAREADPLRVPGRAFADPVRTSARAARSAASLVPKQFRSRRH